MRAVSSRRSAATARRWTSSRASGNAMASSSQVRSRADRKTHMLSIPSSSHLETGPQSRPALICGTSYRTEAVHQWRPPVARLAAQSGMAHHLRGYYPQRGALITRGRGRSLPAARDEHDSVQFLGGRGSIVISTAASAAVQPHPRPPPGHHAHKLSSRFPGRDHVTGPDQIRAPGEPHPAHPTRSIRIPIASRLVMIRISAMKARRGCRAGERAFTCPGATGRVFPDLCCRRDEAPRARSSAFSVLGSATDKNPGMGLSPGFAGEGWRVAAGCPASREEQHVI